jgi:hypothetical protein
LISHSYSVPVSRSLQVPLPASQPMESAAGGSPVESLQSHCILTMSHCTTRLLPVTRVPSSLLMYLTIYCSSCLVMPVQIYLFCSACPVLPVLFCLYCFACPVLLVDFCLPCPGCHVHAVLFCLSSSSCLVLTGTSCPANCAKTQNKCVPSSGKFIQLH